jgi:ATP-dependent helicase/nuclease subunit B
VASGLKEAADAGRVVLAPSTELAAALFDAVERAHRDAGREVWPTPRVRDFGGWLRDQHARRQLADSSTLRCLSDVEERELWRRVVLESEASREFLEPSGAAHAARRARRAIYEYGIPLGAIDVHGTLESRTLLDWNERFAQRCRALDCISADQLLSVAERLPPSPEADSISWIESPQWRPVARRWLERHAGPALPACAPRPGESQPPPRFLQAVSSPAELAGIAEWAHASLEANPSFRAWVCIRDLAPRRAAVVDALDAVLAPQRFSLHDAEDGGASYAVAGGTPLADYAPVRVALEFLSACSGRVSFDRFSDLLRAPQLHASLAEASDAARLDALLRTRAPSEAPLGEWLALGARTARAQSKDPPAALERLSAASRALEELRGNQPLSRWLAIWVLALELGPWAHRHRWSSGEFQAVERFRELLATLAVGDQLFESQSRQSAESILQRAARDTAFQIQTGIPPIWVSGQLTDPWLAYDGLWVTGCDEDRWPPPVDPIPLLPVTVQRQYGVIAASVDAQLHFAEDLQRRWLARARSCVLSCADPGEGRSATPSPLLAAVGALPATAARPTPQPHWIAQLHHAPLLDALTDESAPPFGSDERTRGVATLKAQSLCPFRGFAETRLSAHVLERPVPGFNERERGELLHEALQRIWTEVGDSDRLTRLMEQSAAFTQLLSESVLAAIHKLCERRDPGPRWRDREHVRLLRLLHRWLELERERAPFAVERLETGAEIAHHGGLGFSVRVDRIDRLTADGARVLIDYKTGAAAPDWRGDRPDNPQLPLYALLHREDLVAVAYGRVNAAECRFVTESERDGIFSGRRSTKLEGMKTFAELIDTWQRRIEALAQEFARGYAAVDPTLRACRFCRLEGLCRVPSTLDLSVGEGP